jgi:hypothetical protein
MPFGRLNPAVRLQTRWESVMAFLFKVETTDGLPAEPPTLSSAVPNWRAGDTIPPGSKTLRVLGLRDDDADQPPVLIVKDMADESLVTGCEVS